MPEMREFSWILMGMTTIQVSLSIKKERQLILVIGEQLV